MQEPEWDRDQLSYLVGHVVLEALDFGGDGVRESFWYVQGNLLETTPPFESWSEERRLRIAREVMISLARDGLAEFSEDLPFDGHPDWVPRGIRGFMDRTGLWSRVVSWEERQAWHREHLLPAREVVAMLDRNVDLWWAGQRGQEYEYFLTDKGTALAKSWWTNFSADLAARVTESGASNT